MGISWQPATTAGSEKAYLPPHRETHRKNQKYDKAVYPRSLRPAAPPESHPTAPLTGTKCLNTCVKCFSFIPPQVSKLRTRFLKNIVKSPKAVEQM